MQLHFIDCMTTATKPLYHQKNKVSQAALVLEQNQVSQTRVRAKAAASL